MTSLQCRCYRFPPPHVLRYLQYRSRWVRICNSQKENGITNACISTSVFGNTEERVRTPKFVIFWCFRFFVYFVIIIRLISGISVQKKLHPRSLLPTPSLKTINKTYICKNKTNIYINKIIICTNISFIYSFQRG